MTTRWLLWELFWASSFTSYYATMTFTITTIHAISVPAWNYYVRLPSSAAVHVLPRMVSSSLAHSCFEMRRTTVASLSRQQTPCSEYAISFRRRILLTRASVSHNGKEGAETSSSTQPTPTPLERANTRNSGGSKRRPTRIKKQSMTSPMDYGEEYFSNQGYFALQAFLGYCIFDGRVPGMAGDMNDPSSAWQYARIPGLEYPYDLVLGPLLLLFGLGCNILGRNALNDDVLNSWQGGRQDETTTVDDKEEETVSPLGLKPTGILSYTRNPTYLGLLLVAVGISVLNNSLFRLFLTCLLYMSFSFKIDMDEDKLANKYRHYKQYQDLVKGKIVPSVPF